MFVQILGSAAGGGFPQWNCNCANCAGFRNGSLRAQARTQSSIAISDDGVSWVLCNASPDIRAQLQGFAPMQPGRALRDTGIGAIILMTARSTTPPACSACVKAARTKSGVPTWSMKT